MAKTRVDGNGVTVAIASGDPGSVHAVDAPRRATLMMPREEFAPSLDDDGNAVIDMLSAKLPPTLGPTTH